MYRTNWAGESERMLCQDAMERSGWRLTQRKRASAEVSARGALDAITGHTPVNKFARHYGVHPTQITHWQHRLQKAVPDIFSARRTQREHDQAALQAQVWPQSGQRKVALGWLKKAGLTT
jgi:hypothetical protein